MIRCVMLSSASRISHNAITRRFERVWRISVACVTTGGLLFPTAFAQADMVKDLLNYLMLGVATVLSWIITFCGYLVILLVGVLVDVAQYNDFVNAAPVLAGWPLVRDITNMFFIVVLLLTAFATIIQWHKFDYRRILPKLLLMAVLVNFSKTLIGLLIDFSQVLMLTFVNGFKAAAAGNFVTALKLDKMLSLGKDQTGTEDMSRQAKDPVLLKLLLAELLAIFFLGITIVMLLILIVYLIARVVGLWLALIMSIFCYGTR
jgi:hypothetical protein